MRSSIAIPCSFLLKEPFVWLLDLLAHDQGMWIIAREVVEHYGDLKKAESAIGTGPFLLERYEPNVKTVFKRHPDYFLKDLPWVDGVEWLVLDDPSDSGWPCTARGSSTAAQRAGGPCASTTWRRSSRVIPSAIYRDFLSPIARVLFMRTDQPPFNDVRVRRALSHAIDRQASLRRSGSEANRPPPSPRPGRVVVARRSARRGSEVLSVRPTGGTAPAGGGRCFPRA